MGLDTEEKGGLEFAHAQVSGSSLKELKSTFRSKIGDAKGIIAFDRLSHAEQLRAMRADTSFVPRDPASTEATLDWVILPLSETNDWVAVRDAVLTAQGEEQTITVLSPTAPVLEEEGESGIALDESNENDGDSPTGASRGDGAASKAADGATAPDASRGNGEGQADASDGSNVEAGGGGTGDGLSGTGTGFADGILGGRRGGGTGGILGGTLKSRGVAIGGRGGSRDLSAPVGGIGTSGRPSGRWPQSASGRRSTRSSGAHAVGAGSRPRTSRGSSSTQAANASNGRSSSERGEGPEGVGAKRGTDKPYSWHDVSIDMLGIANAAGRSESGSRSGGVPGGWGWLGRKGTFWQAANILTTVLTGGIVGAILSLPALIKSLPKLTWALIKSLPSLLRLGLRGLAKLLRVGVRNLRSLAVTGAQHLDAARQRFLGALWRLPTQLLSRMRGPGRANPSELRFSQPTASPNFSDGGTINDTIRALQNGLSPDSIPTIRIFERNGIWFTIDNRRLAAFIAARVDDIPVIRITKSNADIARKIKERFDPIDGIGEMIVIVAKKGRKSSLATLSKHGKLP